MHDISLATALTTGCHGQRAQYSIVTAVDCKISDLAAQFSNPLLVGRRLIGWPSLVGAQLIPTSHPRCPSISKNPRRWLQLRTSRLAAEAHFVFVKIYIYCWCRVAFVSAMPCPVTVTKFVGTVSLGLLTVSLCQLMVHDR